MILEEDASSGESLWIILEGIQASSCPFRRLYQF
jgi:hypothetical protein